MSAPKIIAVSGVKNSGKTTLLEKLIPALRKRGISCAAFSQLVFTPDSVYYIPIASIDSVGFVTPENKYRPEVRRIEGELRSYVISQNEHTILFSSGIPVNIMPKMGDKLVTLEMSDVQLMKRLISNVCEIGGSAVNRGQLTQEEWDRFDKRISVLADAPLYFADTPGLSIGEFRAIAKRLVRERDVKAIFIDYLQLMNYQGKRFSTRQEEVGEISRSLKGIAKELEIPIIVLSQMNREVENREGLEGKRPRLSDLRESGAIEQDADLVLFLYRPEYYGIMTDDQCRSLIGKTELIIAKHRKGATKTAPGLLMTFRNEYTRFDDEEDAPF